jgi:hypothetical protein
VLRDQQEVLFVPFLSNLQGSIRGMVEEKEDREEIVEQGLWLLICYIVDKKELGP